MVVRAHEGIERKYAWHNNIIIIMLIILCPEGIITCSPSLSLLHTILYIHACACAHMYTHTYIIHTQVVSFWEENHY